MRKSHKYCKHNKVVKDHADGGKVKKYADGGPVSREEERRRKLAKKPSSKEMGDAIEANRQSAVEYEKKAKAKAKKPKKKTGGRDTTFRDYRGTQGVVDDAT